MFGKSTNRSNNSASSKRRKVWVAIVLVVLTCVIIGVIFGVVIPRSRNSSSNDQVQSGSDSSTTPPTTVMGNNTSPTMSATTPPVGAQNSTQTTSPTVPAPVGSSPAPTAAPITSPAPTVNVTFRPGILSGWEAGLNLSQGLNARIIAVTNQTVPYHNGSNSSIPFHGLPDFGATFWDTTSPDNTGGWIYVSNSEMRDEGEGGVGAIKFDKDGHVLDYRMLLTNTTMNCGGGRTPWDTWISCEEYISVGQIYQVHPNGAREPERLTMGLDGDRFESFAYDDRNLSQPYFFATVDRPNGALRRWTPTNADWTTDPWSMLHGPGNLTYLHLTPFNDNSNTSSGTYTWITNRTMAKENAYQHFPETEGIDRVDNILYFVSKPRKVLYMLNLDTLTFTRQSTVFGLFEGAADQIQRIFADDNDGDQILYFTEERDGGTSAGIHGRNSLGQYFTILEGPRTLWRSESTGLAFSPDGHHLYFAFQKHGVVFDVTRNDGLAFHGRSLDVHYHAVDTRHSLRF